jgi:sugar lactone lactonase YvrE
MGLYALADAPAHAQTQDLFVSNTGTSTISRYAGTGPGTFSTTATTLSGGGLNSPQGLAFDTRGDLFAASIGNDTITEFAAGTTPGTFGATSALSGGLNEPFGLAFDARGDLFAANFGNGSITEFAFNPATGTFGAGTTFATGVNAPEGLAFDARGDLFVANAGFNTITEFAFTAGVGTAPGTFGTGTVVETGLNTPSFLAFGPSVPAVPEASTTVSLGLLLALGMGGMVVAAKRKRRA